MNEKDTLTLGSLFDGSGGFCLGGILSGITPLWASEIEPFPIRVTEKRLPQVKHFGDVSKLNGAKLPPVDIITFGSPCQDMSIAGRREGLSGSRSNLFYQAIRIVKEMRCATNGKYPRFIVWENVPGAFSSDKGEDFRCVLEEICKIKSETISVPEPPKGKWNNAGEILGDNFSLAWRVFDSQYWGVPQRRKRIYLVADFDDKCAGKILFESEGLSGYSAEGFSSWQTAAGNSEKCVGTASEEICLNDQGGNRIDITQDKTCTLRAQAHHPPCVLESAGFCTEHSAKAGSIGYGKETSPTLRRGTVPAAICFENHSQDTRYTQLDGVAPTVLSTYGTGGNNQPFVVEPTAFGVCSKDSNAMKSANPRSGFYQTDTSRTLDANGGNPTCNQGGVAVVSVQGSAIGRTYKNGPNGSGVNENVSFTLNATDRHAVAFSQEAYDRYSENEKSGALCARGGMYGGGSETLVYSTSKASYHTIAEKELANTLVATDYKDPPLVNDTDENMHYIVRRLTPTECARLQGFPDWWCADLGTKEPTDEEINVWQNIFSEYNKSTGKSIKPKSEKQIRKWLENPHSDSAEYKMWGNGVTLPVVCFVLSAIVYNTH